MDDQFGIIDRIKKASTTSGREFYASPRGAQCGELAIEQFRQAFIFEHTGKIPSVTSDTERIHLEWRRLASTMCITGHARMALSRGATDGVPLQKFIDSTSEDFAAFIDEHYERDVYIGGPEVESLPRCDDSEQWRVSIAVAGIGHPEVECTEVTIVLSTPPWFDRLANWVRRLFRRPEKWSGRYIMARNEYQ